MDIGAIVAFVGAICGFALVRQSDFVVPGGPPAGPPAGAPGAAPDSTVPAVMLDPFTLEGTYVRLEPLSRPTSRALVAAAAEDRSNYQWTYTPDGLDQMTDYVADALGKVASGAHVAFATVRKSSAAARRGRGGRGCDPLL